MSLQNHPHDEFLRCQLCGTGYAGIKGLGDRCGDCSWLPHGVWARLPHPFPAADFHAILGCPGNLQAAVRENWPPLSQEQRERLTATRQRALVAALAYVHVPNEGEDCLHCGQRLTEWERAESETVCEDCRESQDDGE